MKPDISKYKAFFFDFDGVIADTVDIKTEAFGELFEKYGKEISDKVMKYHRNNGGVSRYEKFKYYYKNLLDKRMDRKIMNKLDKNYSKLVIVKVIEASYIKGVLPFLRRLNKHKKSCFIVSGTPQKEIRLILKRKKISPLFKNAVGSPKSKIKNLRSLLERYGIDPREALFFGDAKSDYDAAHKNFTDFVAIVNKKSRELAGYKDVAKIKDFLSLYKTGKRGS